ncbi:MAG: phosphoribosylaminoimidazolesuccinocarboxamide synthase [Ktedonobacterales bacterium]|nr:phosphoribosylaminoimidazolesuccinocarboxamide synthase [Ktedonobacterales bacterium]
MSTLLTIDLPLPKFGSGKVRETFDVGDQLLMVATDRLSAFDVIMREGIPHKGEVLTRLSAFWFGQTREIIPNHLISIDPAAFPAAVAAQRGELAGRTMLVHKAQRIDFECVVRGYLAGSGWKDYRATGAVSGVPLPSGLRLADRLPEPIFTPATKAATGHDENCTLDVMENAIGIDLAQSLRDASLALYQFAADLAIDRGIIIADTKFEFGLLDGQVIVIDELLTPDSSRFWAAGEYAPGRSPASFDKQFVRDWLETQTWDKSPPPPTLPPEVIAGTAQRYQEAYEWLTGDTFTPMGH